MKNTWISQHTSYVAVSHTHTHTHTGHMPHQTFHPLRPQKFITKLRRIRVVFVASSICQMLDSWRQLIHNRKLIFIPRQHRPGQTSPQCHPRLTRRILWIKSISDCQTDSKQASILALLLTKCVCSIKKFWIDRHRSASTPILAQIECYDLKKTVTGISLWQATIDVLLVLMLIQLR